MSEAASPPASKSMNHLLVLSYVTIVGLWAVSQVVLIPYVVHLLLLVTAILYAGCHRSLVLREDHVPTAEGAEPTERMGETMRKEDAMQFPILGSVSLFALYLAFKYFDKDLVNLIISVYFAGMGCVALTATVAPLADMSSPSFMTRNKIAKEIKIPHPLPHFLGGDSPWDFSFSLTLAEILTFIGSVVFSVFYFKTKHWTMNNVLGIAFCLQGIERFSLGTYKIGAILLVGLFFYDIFWVFGTDVMVTVAKNLDGPIKILFPRSLIPNAETGKIELSLLGLGDIVIPGFFLALMLRFDAHNAKVPAVPTNVHASFSKPYFHSTLFAYVLGLGTTMFVMIKFQAAQPALLYLVPACLGSSLICGIVRGELKDLFDYSEEEDEEEEEGGEKVDGSKEKAAKKDD